MNSQLDYLNKLLDKANLLNENKFEECESFRTSAYAVLEAMLGENSIYLKQLEKRMKGNATAWLRSTRAIIRSAISDIENGVLVKLEYSIIIGTFEDLLLQAKQLNKGGEEGKKPASVLLAAVFEDFLSRLCKVNKLEVPSKANTKIELLKSKSIINPIQSTRLNSIKEIRNYAFHANWDKFSNSDIGTAINDLEDIMSLPFGSGNIESKI